MVARIAFILSAIFLQEWVLLNALLLAAHEGVYSAPLIFTLFALASAVDIIIGFYVGKFLKRKTSHTKLGKYVEKKSARFSQSVNSPRRWLVFLILGNFSFCYVNAAVMGYLELPFWESFAYNFFGNIVAITIAWYAVISISSLFKNAYIAGGVIIAISVLVLFLLRRVNVERL
ncbi:MAG TPA: hypothetical protein VL576_02155 [Candidatus Paceibacterota bacterium]|jgi:membrane protein DedA with SNARE-associated domain|nr:hypothetical protein [Candidatus Paceibacterota bacterium]